MEIGETLLVETRAEWRRWLESHHADRRVRPPAPLEPNGDPLSQRIESGSP